MDKSDFIISKDDLDEIFGGKIEIKKQTVKETVSAADLLIDAPVEKKKEEKPVVTREKKKDDEPPVMEDAKNKDIFKMKEPEPTVTRENDVDDLIRRAQEIERELDSSGAPAAARPLSFQDFLDEKIIVQVFEVFEEIRKILFYELVTYIDQKAVKNMMLRTLEKTAINYVILKNTNWDSAGTLRDNGSINFERVLKNIDAYNDKIKEIDKEIEEVLTTILYMRLKSVKLGLGKEKYETVKELMMKRLNIVEAGYKGEVVKFIREKVIGPAVQRGESEK